MVQRSGQHIRSHLHVLVTNKATCHNTSMIANLNSDLRLDMTLLNVAIPEIAEG